jgi:hypothetical protein
MERALERFLTREQGAVTSDWIVLSFAMIVIVGFVIAMTRDGSLDLAETAMTPLATAQIGVISNVDTPAADPARGIGTPPVLHPPE